MLLLWFTSTFRLTFLHNLRLFFFHQSLHRKLRNSKGWFDGTKFNSNPCLKVLLVRKSHKMLITMIYFDIVTHNSPWPTILILRGSVNRKPSTCKGHVDLKSFDLKSCIKILVDWRIQKKLHSMFYPTVQTRISSLLQVPFLPSRCQSEGPHLPKMFWLENYSFFCPWRRILIVRIFQKRLVNIELFR